MIDSSKLLEDWTHDDLPDDHNVGPEYEDIVRERRLWPFRVIGIVICCATIAWLIWQAPSKAPRSDTRLIVFGMPISVPADTRAIDCRTYDQSGKVTSAIGYGTLITNSPERPLLRK